MAAVGGCRANSRNSHESVIVSMAFNAQPARSIDEDVLCVVLSTSGKRSLIQGIVHYAPQVAMKLTKKCSKPKATYPEFIIRSCARGSPKRQILFDRVGHFQAPYLEDPNTGVKMFESADIIEYLRATYALQQA